MIRWCFLQRFKFLLFHKENTRVFFAKMKMLFGNLLHNFCKQIIVVTSHNFCKLLIIIFCSFKFEKLLTILYIVSLFNLSLCFRVVSGEAIFLLNGVFEQLTCIVLWFHHQETSLVCFVLIATIICKYQMITKTLCQTF